MEKREKEIKGTGREKGKEKKNKKGKSKNGKEERRRK